MYNGLDIFEPIIKPRGNSKLKLNQVDWKDSCVVRSPNWLRDAVMALPAIYQLRQVMPKKASLDIVCPTRLKDLWQHVPWVDNIIPFPVRRVSKEQKERLIEPLNPGVGIVLPNSFGSAKDLCLNKGMEVRVGRKGNLRSPLLTHRLASLPNPPTAATGHKINGYFDLIEPFGLIERTIKYPALTIESFISDRCCYLLDDFIELHDTDRPTLLMSPGTNNGVAKQWPIHHFSELAERWIADGGSVIIVGTSSEKVLGNILMESCNSKYIYNFCGEATLSDLIALFNMVDLCVCNDSGAMHLAAACDCKGVAIFGATSAAYGGPIGGDWVVLEPDLECAPCLKSECKLQTDQYACLNSIKPDLVYEKLLAFIGCI